jgi:plastocyanin
MAALVLGVGGRAVMAQAGGAVSIVDFAFQPGSLEVPVGSSVTWTNNGAAPHTATADDGSFNSGNLAPGASFSQTFNAAGTIAYHCEIHPNMVGSITVTEGAAPAAQAEAPAQATAPAAGTDQAAAPVQAPRTGIGTLALAQQSEIALLAALAAIALGAAAVAYRRI